ncbi:hypothetical protein N752_19050 [Desulforamulus aquiferis]|nr:hypothetical protein N752_19050 [Desulforamulus aquiferis]
MDCKGEKCQELGRNAPTTLDALCPGCQSHFNEVKLNLEAVGVPYIVNNRLVRGLDYYTHTAFEIMAKDIGAQSSIGGGGRYNGLIEACGGPAIPGVGFALGLERILLTAERQGIDFPLSRDLRCLWPLPGPVLKYSPLNLFKNYGKGLYRQKRIILAEV